MSPSVSTAPDPAIGGPAGRAESALEAISQMMKKMKEMKKTTVVITAGRCLQYRLRSRPVARTQDLLQS